MKNGGAAFPGVIFYDEKPIGHEEGMSLRDYFAAHAPSMPSDFCNDKTYMQAFFEWPWHYADRMLGQRGKP